MAEYILSKKASEDLCKIWNYTTAARPESSESSMSEWITAGICKARIHSTTTFLTTTKPFSSAMRRM